MTKPLLLIGPGNSLSDLNKINLNHYNTLAFMGDLSYFNNNNIISDYYTFIDPYTLIHWVRNYQKGLYSKEWLNKVKDSTTLLYNDLLFDGFYQKGLSTEFGEGWLLGEFKNKILPFIGSLFKEVIKIPTEVIYDKFTPNINLYSKHNILIHSNINLNTDKFSTFIIPLSLYYFNPKEILSIGFGDYESPRYNGITDPYQSSTSEYQGYKNSYNSVKEGLLNVLQNLDINIKFLNPNSYYIELEWKMEK